MYRSNVDLHSFLHVKVCIITPFVKVTLISITSPPRTMATRHREHTERIQDSKNAIHRLLS